METIVVRTRKNWVDCRSVSLPKIFCVLLTWQYANFAKLRFYVGFISNSHSDLALGENSWVLGFCISLPLHQFLMHFFPSFCHYVSMSSLSDSSVFHGFVKVFSSILEISIHENNENVTYNFIYLHIGFWIIIFWLFLMLVLHLAQLNLWKWGQLIKPRENLWW